MMGLVELEVMLCIAGYFNAHDSVVEPYGRRVLADMDGGEESRGTSSGGAGDEKWFSSG